ncbi:MAG: NAD(P)-binding domain-containing protein [Planctomycetota bacterium]|jgi:thioredoxin reductase/NAD-dependent dihydropyrimidine dehydrogenase PreA subunit
MIRAVRDFLFRDRPSPSYPVLPDVRQSGESNIPGLYLLGDVAGKPLIKVGLNDGFDLANSLADELGDSARGTAEYDVIVVGAGVAGMATLLRLRERGLSACAIDAGRSFQTLRNFTKGKWLFAEPLDMELTGSIPFEEGVTEDVLEQWDALVAERGLEVREYTKVVDIRRDPAGFRVVSERGEALARRVVVSIGKAGNPRKAGVPGEQEYPEKIAHYLKDPEDYRGKRVLIYGGGDVAAEAALALCDLAEVTLVTIDPEFIFPKKRNVDAMRAKEQQGQLAIRLNTRMTGIGPDRVAIENQESGEKESIANDFVFEMIGAEVPVPFFNKIGIHLQGRWGAKRWLILAASSLLVYTIYSWKKGFWPFPYTGMGVEKLPGILTHPSFWYSGAYTAVMVIFGLMAMKRWSRNWTDRYQIYRFASLIGFQVVSFVLIECLFAVFLPGDVWWRAYAVNNPFPLLFDSFYNMSGVTAADMKWIFVGGGLLMTFVAIPLAARWHGKRFCTWVCGCGGLAETLGDRWRHLAPKGERSRRLEVMGSIVLFWAVVSAAVILLAYDGDTAASGKWHGAYALVVDFWFVAVIPVALYPIWGGKVWCRYWCPLAKYMEVLSRWYGKLAITSNDKCIQCTECSKYCQVGVDVMAFAKNGEPFSNQETSCIHCGICITVCPMDVLKFEQLDYGKTRVTVDVRALDSEKIPA